MNFNATEEWKDLQPIAIFSHPRSGTHVALDFFRRQFAECRTWKRPWERMNRLYVSLESIDSTRSRRITREKAGELLQRVDRPLVKTHWAFGSEDILADREWHKPADDLVAWLRDSASWVYVLRDGRSVMCSYQLFRACFDPKARCSISDFIRQETGGVSRVRFWANHVRCSLTTPGVIQLKYEDLLKEGEGILADLASKLGLTPLHTQPLLPPKPQSAFPHLINRYLGRRPQSSAVLGRPFGMPLQKWQTAFTEEDRQFFEDESEGLLMELGYEASRDWPKTFAAAPNEQPA